MIPASLIPSQTERVYLNDYFDHYDVYDMWIFKHYKDLELDTYDEAESIDADVIADIDNTIRALFFKNADNYDRLYALTLSEYNPLENYDRYEDSTTTQGEREDINTYGIKENTDINGATKVTTEQGITHSESTDKVVGDNATTPQTRGVTETNTNAVTDTVKGDQVTNTHKENEHIDTLNKGEQVDSITSHIHGNIGVTTAVQMMQQDKSFWQNFNLYNVIFDDIIKAISIPVYV